MEDIKQWLADNGSYETGLALLMANSRNKHICRYLSRKNDPEKLTYELSKLVGIAPIAVQNIAPVVAADVEDPIAETKQFSKIDELPEAVRPYAEAAMNEYHKARKAHTLLKSAKNDKSRASFRDELLKHIESNRKYWGMVNNFLKNNILPEVQAVLTANELLTTASTLSRNLKAVEECTDDVKRAELIVKIKSNMTILKEAGRKFNDKTTDRLIKLNLL